MSGERVGKALEWVAELAKAAYDYSGNETAIGEVLEVRLGPLLRAGQEMHDRWGAYPTSYGPETWAWEKALAALEFGEDANRLALALDKAEAGSDLEREIIQSFLKRFSVQERLDEHNRFFSVMHGDRIAKLEAERQGKGERP